MLLLLACVETTKEPSVAQTSEDSDSATETTATEGVLQLSFDAALQRSNWGADLGRCSVKVTFTRQPQTDGMGDQPGQLWDPLETPTQDQECAVTLRDKDAMREALENQDPPPDNWILVGTVEMGSHVQLVSASRTVELGPTYDPDGNFLAYEMADCSMDTFPFNDTFDLVVPDGNATENIPAFTIPGAAVIGPRIDITSIKESDPRMGVSLSQSQDFPITWSYGGEINTNVTLDHQVMATLRNNTKDGLNEFQAIMCLANPPDGSMPEEITFRASDLSQLEANPTPGGPNVLAIQLDSRTNGPDITLPWGQRIRMMSTISVDGVGELLP